MTMQLHNDLSFDNLQHEMFWYDDFYGDVLDDRWTTTGTAAVVDAQDGGICRLTTGATTNDNAFLSWNTIRTLHVNKKITIETRVRYNDATATQGFIYLIYDGDNQIYFWFNQNINNNIYIHCENNTAITELDSGINIDTDYHIYRIETSPTAVRFYIDGVQCANSPITTNIPSDAGDYLQPSLRVNTREDVAKSMDIDYVWVRQDR